MALDKLAMARRVHLTFGVGEAATLGPARALRSSPLLE